MKIVVCSSHDWANLGHTVAKSFRSIGLDSQSYALLRRIIMTTTYFTHQVIQIKKEQILSRLMIV
jgi:hypothetical protein